MRCSTKATLLRSSALATFAAIGAMGLGAPAKAVTVNSITQDAIFDAGGICGVRMRANLTGVVSDFSNADYYVIGLGNSTNGLQGSLVNSTVSVGATITTQQLTFGIPPQNGRDDYFMRVWETTQAASTSNLGAVAGSLQIARADLIAAGGACALAATNSPPVADAGSDQTFLTTSASGVVLPADATGSSDADNDPLTFSWTQVLGPQAGISNANQSIASIVFPTLTGPTVFEFQVTVTDAALDTSTDTVRFSLTPPNAAPAVDAGPDQTVIGGSAVTLAGTASDADNDPLTFQWTQTGGPTVSLSGDTTLSPTFTAPPRSVSAQVLTFELAVNDGNATSTDTVTITVPANQAPNADAGQAQTVPGGSNVALDASASSDPEGDPIIFNWTQVSGPSVTLSAASSANPTFTAPQRTSNAQVLEFEVRVTDSFDASDTATVQITIPANQLPLADAGPDQSVTGSSNVTLDGSGSSDPDGDPIFYSWTQTGGPSVTLTNPTNANPTFVAPASTTTNQVLTFQLTVTDDDGSGIPGGRIAPSNPQQDTVEITILANSPPVADAGADQGPIDAGQTVTLDGSGSSDPDNDALGFTWTQVSGTPVILTGGNSVAPTFVAPIVNGNEDLVFSLIVDDGQAQSAADTVVISVRAVGSITIIQRVVGGDAAVTFTSDVAALNGSLTTSGGTAQVSAANVPTGSYTVSVNDIRTAGFALTDITCNDADSVTNVVARSVSLELAPGEDLVCTFTSTNSRGAAQTAIADFLTGRNALIMSHQPDLQRRLDRLTGVQAQGGTATAFGLPIPGSGALPFALALGNGQAKASTSLAQVSAALDPQDRSEKDFDVWGEVFFSRARLGNQKANFRIFHIGADYRFGDDLLVGILAEFDDFNDRGDLEAGEAEGEGFLVGPYVMARIGPDLFGELRAAWGSSDNRVNPLGGFTDDFDTSRSYYSGSLVGQFDVGKHTQLRPEVTLRYLDETQEVYTDSLGVMIPEQSVGQGDISFRPRLQHVLVTDSGWTLRPFIEAEGIYTFGTQTNTILQNGLRARIESGIDFFSKSGVRASVGAFHDGIGVDRFESTGAHASVSFRF